MLCSHRSYNHIEKIVSDYYGKGIITTKGAQVDSARKSPSSASISRSVGGSSLAIIMDKGPSYGGGGTTCSTSMGTAASVGTAEGAATCATSCATMCATFCTGV